MVRGLIRYIDISYFVRFMLLFLALYYFNIFYLGITTAGGKFYSPFLEHHLNYINWIRNAILYTANFIDNILGVHSYVDGPQIIKSSSGVGVNVWLPCLGLGIISFWIAFVITQTNNWHHKLIWSLAGVVIVWFINCWRIALLLLSLDHKWKGNIFIDHHKMFNIVAYSVIIYLMYLTNTSVRMNTL